MVFVKSEGKNKKVMMFFLRLVLERDMMNLE